MIRGTLFMLRNCVLLSCLLASGLHANSILNGGFETGDLTGYSIDPGSNMVTTPTVFAPSGYQLSDPLWFSVFPTAPEGNFYAFLSNGPGATNGVTPPPTDVSILNTIPYLVSPGAALSFQYDFLSEDFLGDSFLVNVLVGGVVAGNLLTVPDSDATNNLFGFGICGTAPEGTILCADTGLTTFQTAANALSAFNGQQVQFQFLVSDSGVDDNGFDSAAILDNLNGSGLQVVGATTPEPGTIFLAGGALAALALRKLRSQI
jgi:hypothetical protein